MKYIISMAMSFLVSLMISMAGAGELQEIELDDGGTIRAEVQALQDGIYTLKSPSLGTLRIEATKIRAMRSLRPNPNTRQVQQPTQSIQPSVDAQIQGLQQQILGNPSIMSMIQALQQSPAMQDVLSDAEIQQALNSGDMGVLLSHPKIQRLLHDDTMQQIMQEIKP